ncbi:chromosome segregation protein SMC [Tessaracoccus sp. SD287]|uniref:chromosome segregation protein SMC n=1 Tax=Tessaracoccus sp. SD287 TaxID=2782008 RepID=UPI001A97216D|nr:chromosome segregation protein SMC [Tessaracoccus sp. SD287]
MYLKSLTLRGFKSFASATTMNFEPGVTCIVGPNGSGKSNVVDALSWVMGEQGAKSLRGGKMEDVIFAGTTGRAPLGRAEVVLTIDNTDGALPIDYTEVTITRTMFRSGGSEYQINGNPARLLDVQELLSDSGIGREMHVIVGQGQLDSILQATPEIRRGFIEEAAGVLKHRKRKEKAQRKLESTAANLDRLSDLIGEIRRQLKPLGRQAEVARKAAVIAAELRDAKARLLADDLSQATLALESDLADERAFAAARAKAQHDLDAARAREVEAESALSAAQPRVNAAQENWYALAALVERIQTTRQIAAERMRHAERQPELNRGGRDPESLEKEAAEVREQEALLRDDVAARAEEMSTATALRSSTEQALATAEKAYAAQLRAIADRREGLARLTGQVNSLKSRLDAGADEAARLEARRADAMARAGAATAEFARVESSMAGFDAGEEGLDEEYETASAQVSALDEALAALRADEAALSQTRAALVSRIDGLSMGLERADANSSLLAASDRVDGLLGQVAGLLQVEPGWQAAVAAALGQATDAVAVADLEAALAAISHVRAEDLGRAGLLLGGPPVSRDDWPALPGTAVWARDVVRAPAELDGALTRALHRVALVDDLDAARALVDGRPDVTAVTRDGDSLSSWFAQAGSGGGASLIEVQAAVDEARAQLGECDHDLERLRFAVAEKNHAAQQARQRAEEALTRLHASDAEWAALSERLGQLSETARSARSEAERLEQTALEATAKRHQDEAALAELQQRLDLASDDADVVEPDPAERDDLALAARTARQGEMDARLALRTAEERARALAGRADSLQRAAQNERVQRAKAQARADQVRREAEAARAVHLAAVWLLEQVEVARVGATAERTAAEQHRQLAEAELGVARRTARESASALEKLVEGAHRDEMARVQQRMRIEQLQDKAMDELALAPQILLDEYGPEQWVPVLVHPDGRPVAADDEDKPEPVPYDREAQQKRLRTAERNLQVLGRVNPLALEEFDAMQERHAFLAEQLEDLNKTRKDLVDIIAEVDRRVEEVFALAYADVEQTFGHVFSRLFPGGEGRLILTEPGQWLTTGVDVEARPAGKKVKRLSLLSGGERSLVAVAFLVSLFMARPSPFYILDEVEAALDDTNLGRLLGIYEELRERSQLLVITHQKRTMEIADALYGVTMRGDGVSTVVSQRLRDEPAAAQGA